MLLACIQACVRYWGVTCVHNPGICRAATLFGVPCEHIILTFCPPPPDTWTSRHSIRWSKWKIHVHHTGIHESWGQPRSACGVVQDPDGD